MPTFKTKKKKAETKPPPVEIPPVLQAPAPIVNVQADRAAAEAINKMAETVARSVQPNVPWRFKIKRDRNGLIEDVVATPLEGS